MSEATGEQAAVLARVPAPKCMGSSLRLFEAMMTKHTKAKIIAIVTWHFCFALVALVHTKTTGRLTTAAYTALFGDVQATYSRYARISAYSSIVIVTLPATVISYALFARISAYRQSRTDKLLLMAMWLIGVIAQLIASYEIGLPYKLSQLDWALFGQQEIYSIRNLILPRVVAMLICSIAIAWVTLGLSTRLAAREARAFPVLPVSEESCCR